MTFGRKAPGLGSKCVVIVVIMAMANDAYKGLTPSRALMNGPMTKVPLAIVEEMAFTVPRL